MSFFEAHGPTESVRATQVGSLTFTQLLFTQRRVVDQCRRTATGCRRVLAV